MCVCVCVCVCELQSQLKQVKTRDSEIHAVNFMWTCIDPVTSALLFYFFFFC